MATHSKIIQKLYPGVNEFVYNVIKEVHACGLLVQIVTIVLDSKKWPSIEAYIDALGYIPDMETQINSMSRVLKDADKKYIKKLKESGNIFKVVKCNICKELVYVPGMKKNDNCVNGVEGHCICCHAKKENERKPIQITGEQQKEYRRILDENIDSADPLRKSVDKYFDTLCSHGNKVALMTFCANPLAMYECIHCKKGKYMFKYESNFSCARGFRNGCNECRSSAKGVTNNIIKNMKGDAKKRGFAAPSDEVCRSIVKSRVNADGTFISSINGGTFGKPDDPPEFKPSIDRPNRVENYHDDNANVVCVVFNTSGSGFNVDRKRLSQIEAAPHLPVIHPKEYATYIKHGKNAGIPHFCTYMLNKCQTMAAERRGRGDDSWMVTVTAKEMYEDMESQGFRCAQTGVPIYLLGKNPWSVSVDRKDNTKGYTRENNQYVASMYNPGHKLVLTPELFKEYISRTTNQNRIERAAEFGYDLDENGMPLPSAVDVLMERPVEYVEEVAATKRPKKAKKDIDDDSQVSTSKKRKRGGR